MIGNKIIHYETITSTNDELKKMANMSEIPHGLVLTADEQTKGRGRVYNRKWNSTKGQGVYMSIFVRPTQIPLEQIGSLTLVTATAVKNAIAEISGIDCKIKWPNDIVANNKKMSGILLEADFVADACRYIIIGIGVNVLMNDFDEELRKIATSLFLETGRRFSIDELISSIIRNMNLYYDIFTRNGFDAIKNEYVNSCINLNGNTNFILNKEKEILDEVMAIDISHLGDLVVKNKNAEIYSVNSGEVSVKINFNKI